MHQEEPVSAPLGSSGKPGHGAAHSQATDCPPGASVDQAQQIPKSRSQASSQSPLWRSCCQAGPNLAGISCLHTPRGHITTQHFPHSSHLECPPMVPSQQCPPWHLVCPFHMDFCCFADRNKRNPVPVSLVHGWAMPVGNGKASSKMNQDWPLVRR